MRAPFATRDLEGRHDDPRDRRGQGTETDIKRRDEVDRLKELESIKKQYMGQEKARQLSIFLPRPASLLARTAPPGIPRLTLPSFNPFSAHSICDASFAFRSPVVHRPVSSRPVVPPLHPRLFLCRPLSPCFILCRLTPVARGR